MIRTPPPPAIMAALLGAAVFAALLGVRELSFAFGPGTTTDDHPWRLLVALLIGAGLLWTALVPVLKRMGATRLPLWAIVLSGLALRALFFGSQPIYENDFNRYLLDGAVAAQGLNPYASSPAEALASDDARVAELVRQSDGLVTDINNATLTTIYPPTAQAAFALAHVVSPFSRDALRFVFLLSELAALLLLARALPGFGRSANWALLYALCPLAAFAGFNTMHMDLLLAPFLLGALLLIRARPALAGLSLALAAGVKIWPLLLAPVLFRRWFDRPARLALFAALVGTASLILFAPLLLALGGDSGLQAYSVGWNRSAFLFPRIEAALSYHSDDPGRMARLLVAAALGSGAILLGWMTRDHDDTTLPAALLAVTAALLFLSPTGYPWYAVWLVPFLPFAPRYGLALLATLVALHYSRFAFGEAGNYGVYLDVLVPIQFGVPLLVLALESFTRKERRHAAPLAA